MNGIGNRISVESGQKRSWFLGARGPGSAAAWPTAKEIGLKMTPRVVLALASAVTLLLAPCSAQARMRSEPRRGLRRR